MSRRKDYQAVPDTLLDRLKADALPILNTVGHMTIPAKTIYWMAMELIDSREEIFRLQLCDTVDKIISDELEDEEDLLAFTWPGDENPYMVSDMGGTSVFKPAFPCGETVKLPRSLFISVDLSSEEQDGRRMPKAGR